MQLRLNGADEGERGKTEEERLEKILMMAGNTERQGTSAKQERN